MASYSRRKLTYGLKATYGTAYDLGVDEITVNECMPYRLFCRPKIGCETSYKPTSQLSLRKTISFGNCT
jgi:hypothetical protein